MAEVDASLALADVIEPLLFAATNSRYGSFSVSGGVTHPAVTGYNQPSHLVL